MSTDLDKVLDLRLARTRLWRWRLIAGGLALVAILAGLAASRRGDDAPGGMFGERAHIARLDITGLITNNRAELELIKHLSDDPAVKAVILAVDSPGGTTTGGEVLYNALSDLEKKKPVVAVGGTIATSAAYMVSLAADRFFVHGNTITGSVGVIFQYPEVDSALDKLGIKMHEIKSGPLKAVPSMFEPLDDKGRNLAEGMVKEGQTWFLGLVTARRGIAAKDVPGLEDGSIFSGRQAVTYKLADAIGGEQEAITWLEKEKGIASNLPVIDRKPHRPPGFGLLGEAGAGRTDSFSGYVQTVVEQMTGSSDLARLRLDGLLSVWHVDAN